MIPHGVTVAELQARLSSAGVHPVFILTDSSLEDEYRALVGEIGFGAVVAVDQTTAAAANYNDDYLLKAMMDGLEVLTYSLGCWVGSAQSLKGSELASEVALWYRTCVLI